MYEYTSASAAVAAIAVLAVLIILYLFTNWYISKLSKAFIYGWYGADPVYCEEANLDSMILFLNNDGYGYILIKGNDDTIILNDSFTYSLMEKSGSFASITEPRQFTIKFKNIDYQEFFPSVQTLEFIPLTQRIKLYDDNEKMTHAILYKNNMVSDVMSLTNQE